MKELLRKVFKGSRLSRGEAFEAMSLIMEGEVPPEQVAGFLGALAARGETADELVGCVEAMRAKALPFPSQRDDLIDVCGTGGDDLHTFNISTTNALLLSAAGLGVVKHGNRAVSSQSGSADVLEKLGIQIDSSCLEKEFEQAGFVFLFAPRFHPAMKNVASVRKALGLRTLFNLLGPLSNPAPVRRQVIGVFEERLVPLMAEAIAQLGTEDTLVVFGKDGLDELTLSDKTLCARIRDDRIETFTLTPEDFGLSSAPLSSLRGGTAQENALITRRIFEGEKGPKRDIVVMNAAAALVIAGRSESWRDGARLAESIIDGGEALRKIEELKGFSL